MTSPDGQTSRESQWGDGLPRWLIAFPIVLLLGLVAGYVYGIPLLAGVVALPLFASSIAIGCCLRAGWRSETQVLRVWYFLGALLSLAMVVLAAVVTLWRTPG